MRLSKLLELAKAADYDQLETTCLELLASGQLALRDLVGPFEQLERDGRAERLVPLAQMVLENVEPASDPQAALALARMALIASPKSEDLRRTTIDLYRRLYGHTARFNVVLETSGLLGGRPVRSALKLLDLCLTLQPKDTLISRMDGRVVEVTDIDRENGLFTLRREGRVTTVPAPEVAREYDRISGDDFRVLRQLRPERLAALLQEDPVAVVTGLIHAHGEHIDADQLKDELVPRYIESRQWSRWWTRARNLLKRSAHVIIEGRSPIILSYSARARTLEDETWETFVAQNDPADWLVTAEGYLREKTARKEPPDQELLSRFHDHLLQYVAAARARRPAEALAGALVIGRLGEKGMPTTEQTRELAVTMLREVSEPAALLARLEHDAFRERSLEVLEAARPVDWIEHALAWLPTAPAVLLDKLVVGAIAAGRLDAVQRFIDAGLNDLPGHTELVYWLWRGPKHQQTLDLPSEAELFQMILDTLSTLGRSVPAEPRVVKAYRQRMKAALSLRGYQGVRRCLAGTSEAAAITIRRQLQRLEGLGDNARTRMLEMLREAHPELWLARPEQVAPWEDPEILWTTSAGLIKRAAERDQIVNVQMRENARRIGEAAAHGDLSENAEYRFALEERDLLRARLARVNDELSRARVLTQYDVPNDHVGVGSRVTLRCLADGAERVMTFLGPFDTDVERGVYSYLAPVAQKLMGCRVGDRVTLTFDGRDLEFEVVAQGSAPAITGGA